ncbi:hypothetical protein ACU686_27405 [Yinghuangia aomiensis]
MTARVLVAKPGLDRPRPRRERSSPAPCGTQASKWSSRGSAKKVEDIVAIALQEKDVAVVGTQHPLRRAHRAHGTHRGSAAGLAAVRGTWR